MITKVNVQIRLDNHIGKVTLRVITLHHLLLVKDTLVENQVPTRGQKPETLL